MITQALDARLLPADALPAHAVQGERLRHDVTAADNGTGACCPPTTATTADLGFLRGPPVVVVEVPVQRRGHLRVYAGEGN